jgi:hypothetical protein
VAVLENEEGKLVLSGFVPGRCVDVHLAKAIDGSGMVGMVMNRAVWNIAEVETVFAGNVENAGLRRAARFQIWVSRVEHFDPIDREAVSIEAGFDRFGRSFPDSPFFLLESQRSFPHLPRDRNLFCILRANLKSDPVVLVDDRGNHRCRALFPLSLFIRKRGGE